MYQTYLQDGCSQRDIFYIYSETFSLPKEGTYIRFEEHRYLN